MLSLSFSVGLEFGFPMSALIALPVVVHSSRMIAPGPLSQCVFHFFHLSWLLFFLLLRPFAIQHFISSSRENKHFSFPTFSRLVGASTFCSFDDLDHDIASHFLIGLIPGSFSLGYFWHNPLFLCGPCEFLSPTASCLRTPPFLSFRVSWSSRLSVSSDAHTRSQSYLCRPRLI